MKGWTDAWLRDALAHGDQISEKRLSEGEHIVKQIDPILRSYFEAKKWPYRPMKVIFLPPRLLQDERHRENITSGMFIPYYPDAFFATVDWPIPLELTLVYESFHFNASGSPFGGSLSAGVTMSAAQYLVRKYDLLSAGKVNQVDAFPMERKGVEVLLDEMVKRTGRTHDEALEMLLEAYLTGKQDEIRKVFGSESWDRVLKLSYSKKGWQKHRIAKALEK